MGGGDRVRARNFSGVDMKRIGETWEKGKGGDRNEKISGVISIF